MVSAGVYLVGPSVASEGLGTCVDENSWSGGDRRGRSTLYSLLVVVANSCVSPLKG